MDNVLKTSLRICGALPVLSLILWLVAEDLRPIAAGLFAGSLISMANAVLLRKQIGHLSRIADGGKRKKSGLSAGFGTRTAMVLLGALLAYRYPHVLNLPAVLAASFIVQFTALLVMLRQTIQGRG